MEVGKMDSYIIWDERLKGSMPTIGGILKSCIVNASISNTTAFAMVNAFSASEKIENLYILCHGYGSGMHLGTFDFLWRGGLGLQLGKENLLPTTVSSWSAIKDKVKNIIIYACGAAYKGTAALDPTKPQDGQSLMSALSKETNAVVFAADKMQVYYPDNLNFGKWEGQIYAFFPNGMTLPFPGVPKEILDVTSPIEETGFWGTYKKIVRQIELNK